MIKAFCDKKIAVLGFGVEGGDVVNFLLTQGTKNITVFDQKPASELGDSLVKLQKSEVKFKLGTDYLKGGLLDFEIVFRSPAFKLSLPELVEAKMAGAVISSATKLFFDLCPAKIIGVTGTKGKGTTSTLIYEILKKAGKKVFLAGNIGEPMLLLLPKLLQDSWVVLELSSFQLQDLEKSPHLGVVLFITSEHLNYHQNTQEYIEAKLNIVSHQLKGDFAVLNADNPISSSFAAKTPARIYYFSREKRVEGGYVEKNTIFLLGKTLGKTTMLKIRGEHNQDNICAAAIASFLAGADVDSIKKVVFSFPGLEHRLELVARVEGVSFYNDSFSTIPETAIAAIRSFSEPIILIAGGSEKGSDYTLLGQEIAKSSVKCLILIGEMARKIKNAVSSAGFSRKMIFRPKDMEEIVKSAFEESLSGDVVLLSPACASFGMFKNYKDRGNQFKNYVKTLKGYP